MKAALFTAAASLVLMSAGVSQAATNLVTNGDFETNAGNGQVGFNTSVADWTVPTPTVAGGSYVFVFNASASSPSGTTADTTGANGVASPPPVALWGPGNGAANGLTVSPDGGAFVASSPTYHPGALTQMVSGLTPGAVYTLTFDWAAGQQQGFDGATTEGWQVKLGNGPAQSTPLVTISDKGFSGWMSETFAFTADATSDPLSFLAISGPGSPDLEGFSLLDSVTLVPEPAAWSLMLVGVGAIGAMLRMRRREIAAV